MKSKFISSILAIAVVLAMVSVPMVVPGVVPPKVALASGNVTVKIENATTRVGTGCSFTIYAVVNNPSAQPVAVHQICLNFDPNYFTVDNVSRVDFTVDMGPAAINNTAGHVDYVTAMPMGQSINDTHIVSCRINCTAKALEGVSTVSWVYEMGPPPRRTKVDYAGVDYLEGGNMSLMFNGTVEVVPSGILQGHVDLQGMPATNVTVRFFDLGTQNETMKKYRSTDSSGNFTIAVVTSGTYDVAVKGSTSLSSLQTGINLTVGVITYRDFGALLEGDSSGNDYVDGSDYGLLSFAWLSWPGQPNWDARADFSRDAYIDGSDFGPLSFNWLEWGDCYGWPGNWM